MWSRWLVVRNNIPFTICLVDEDITSPTPDPQPSQPSALPPEPTADSEPKPAMTIEQSPEANFITEPEPNLESVEFCELATASVIEGILVDFTGMDWSPALTLTAEVQTQSWFAGFHQLHLGSWIP